MLIRYKVGHGLNFHIDLSPVTGGVWLDAGEWEALKSKGLHSQLNLIFTASYQRQIRTAEYEATLEQTFKTRIGDPDFEKVSAFENLARHSTPNAATSAATSPSPPTPTPIRKSSSTSY